MNSEDYPHRSSESRAAGPVTGGNAERKARHGDTRSTFVIGRNYSDKFLQALLHCASTSLRLIGVILLR